MMATDILSFSLRLRLCEPGGCLWGLGRQFLLLLGSRDLERQFCCWFGSRDWEDILLLFGSRNWEGIFVVFVVLE